jgi:NhaP-type Na+/H+ or K+/H+ antiporter
VLGQVASRVILSNWGDGGETRERGENAGLTMMAGTFVSYGLAELFSGYGFLAVFVAAVSVRSFARGHDTHDPYVRHPHRFGDQFESLLLALLLLWLGAALATGTMAGWTWAEAGVACLLVFVIRPAAGWIAMTGLAGPDGAMLSRRERLALSFYGVRGLGTVFYIAYGVNHADFADTDVIWRVALIAITLSIVVHGISAGVVMRRVGR